MTATTPLNGHAQSLRPIPVPPRTTAAPSQPVPVVPSRQPVPAPTPEPGPSGDEEGAEALPWQQRIVNFLADLTTESWLISAVVHLGILLFLALVLGKMSNQKYDYDVTVLDTVEDTVPDTELTHFEVGDPPLEPTELTTETLTLAEAPTETVDAQFNDNSPVFEEAGGGVASATSNLGGLGGFNISGSGLGPMLKGPGGVDGGGGLGKNFGHGGAGEGFGSRGSGMREAMLGNGATKQSERAVAAALNWLSRHQELDGSWNLDHTRRCRSGRCSGPGDTQANSAATAMGLLPFFAAGQTHQSKGPYQKNIAGGVNYLLKVQTPDGDLSQGAHQMYTHGLATIALCEAYGMTQDSRIGIAAQRAIDFIEAAQNREGAWRYTKTSQDSDMSVFGWQVMALKSGQMAGLKVRPLGLEGCRKYLRESGTGRYHEQFGYTSRGGSTPPMTAVGLLTSQYLGAEVSDPVVMGGVDYLAHNRPSLDSRNIYYWYYATQAMHNVPGPEWDAWNRQMRKILIETQEKSGCAAGSWDPEKPSHDVWGRTGGRLMMTSLSCLTLEVYYRYLPLYKLDKKAETKEFELK